MEQILNTFYEMENKREHKKSSKATHSATGVSINVKSAQDIEYYNLHHQRLAGVPEK